MEAVPFCHTTCSALVSSVVPSRFPSPDGWYPTAIPCDSVDCVVVFLCRVHAATLVQSCDDCTYTISSLYREHTHSQTHTHKKWDTNIALWNGTDEGCLLNILSLTDSSRV